jgi:hypothetical protein
MALMGTTDRGTPSTPLKKATNPHDAAYTITAFTIDHTALMPKYRIIAL